VRALYFANFNVALARALGALGMLSDLCGDLSAGRQFAGLRFFSFSDYGLSTYCRTSLVRFYNFHRNLFQVFQAPFHVYQDWSATFSALAKLQVKLSSIWFAYWHMYEAIKLSESARASDSFRIISFISSRRQTGKDSIIIVLLCILEWAATSHLNSCAASAGANLELTCRADAITLTGSEKALMNTRSLELPFYRANLRVRARAMNCKPVWEYIAPSYGR